MFKVGDNVIIYGKFFGVVRKVYEDDKTVIVRFEEGDESMFCFSDIEKMSDTPTQ